MEAKSVRIHNAICHLNALLNNGGRTIYGPWLTDLIDLLTEIKESQPLPITDEWLAACDFKWSQSERQPNKHWKLQLNTVREGSLAWESTTIEVQRNGWKGWNGDYIGDPQSWMLWITDMFNRTAFLGNIQWQKDIIDIAEIITRRPWNPETHIYGQAWPEGSRVLLEKEPK